MSSSSKRNFWMRSSLFSLLLVGAAACGDLGEADQPEATGESAQGALTDTWTKRGQVLTCSKNSGYKLCNVKNMPLIAQGGTPTDPLDADVAPFGGIACANASHMMMMSAAWNNRTTNPTPTDRTKTFLSLPARNKAGRGSWILRENAKNNGSWFTQWGKPYQYTRPYSMQNFIYDLDPPSTVLWGDNCTLNDWWTCSAYNNYVMTNKEYVGPDSSSYFNSTHVQDAQDDGNVVMLSFYWQDYTVSWPTPDHYVVTYALTGDKGHKVAVNGYYKGQAYDLVINDPGSGTTVRARIGLKTKTAYHVTAYRQDGTLGDVLAEEALPYGAASWPTLEIEGVPGPNMIVQFDSMWMR